LLYKVKLIKIIIVNINNVKSGLKACSGEESDGFFIVLVKPPNLYKIGRINSV